MGARSDINGMAVQQACQTIKARLKPLMDANPTKTWAEICKMAYFERMWSIAFRLCVSVCVSLLVAVLFLALLNLICYGCFSA